MGRDGVSVPLAGRDVLARVLLIPVGRRGMAFCRSFRQWPNLGIGKRRGGRGWGRGVTWLAPIRRDEKSRRSLSQRLDASRWLASNRDLFSCQRAGRTPRGARRRGRIVATGYSLIQSVSQGLPGRSLGSKYVKSLGNHSDQPGSDSENVVDRQHHVVNVATLVFTIHRLSKAIGTSDRRI